MEMAKTTKPATPPKTGTTISAAVSQPGRPRRRRGVLSRTSGVEPKARVGEAAGAPSRGKAIGATGTAMGGGGGGATEVFGGRGGGATRAVAVTGLARGTGGGGGTAAALAGAGPASRATGLAGGATLRGGGPGGLGGAAFGAAGTLAGAWGRNSNFVPQRGRIKLEAPRTASALNTWVQTGLGQGKVGGMAAVLRGRVGRYRPLEFSVSPPAAYCIHYLGHALERGQRRGLIGLEAVYPCGQRDADWQRELDDRFVRPQER